VREAGFGDIRPFYQAYCFKAWLCARYPAEIHYPENDAEVLELERRGATLIAWGVNPNDAG